jgi:hypothetical protein
MKPGLDGSLGVARAAAAALTVPAAAPFSRARHVPTRRRQRERHEGECRDEPQLPRQRAPPAREEGDGTTPIAPTTSAMIASVELLLPPIDETASSVGAGCRTTRRRTS